MLCCAGIKELFHLVSFVQTAILNVSFPTQHLEELEELTDPIYHDVDYNWIAYRCICYCNYYVIQDVEISGILGTIGFYQFNEDQSFQVLLSYICDTDVCQVFEYGVNLSLQLMYKQEQHIWNLKILLQDRLHNLSFI